MKKGGTPWNKGKKASIETRRKISESLIGSHRRLGIGFSEKSKKQISEKLKGRKLSVKTIQKMSESHIKHPENHHSWKGGITKTNLSIRRSFKYRQWISDIFTRDDFTCQDCGIRGCHLHAHHIKKFSIIIKENKIMNIEEAFICEELWNINNGITLCKKCHKKEHKNRIGGD